MKKLGLAASAVIVTLLLAEGVLRLTGWGPLQPGLVLNRNVAAQLSTGVIVSDPVLLWKEARVSLDYDRPDRFLRPGLPAPARSGKRRILCLGDSCTRLADEGVPYSLTLETLLGPDQAEVFNASLPGYTTYQGRTWLERDLLDLDADVVVIYFGWNDHWRSTGFADRELAHLLRPSRSRLLNLLERPHSPPPLRVSPDDYAENLRAMIADVTSRGGKVVVVLAPHHLTQEAQDRVRANHNIIAGDDPIGLHQRYLGIARQTAITSGADVVDAASAFDALGDQTETMMRDGIHLTQLGHLIVANLLSDHVSRLLAGQPTDGLDDPATAWTLLAQLRREQNRWSDTLTALQAAASTPSKQAGLRLNWAWGLATCPVDSLRDGKAALAVLTTLPPQLQDSPDVMEVRAAALAASGRFTDAVQNAEAVVKALGDAAAGTPRLTSLQHRLDSYRHHELGLEPAPKSD